MIDDPLARKILDQSDRIDEIITRLDRGWIESANVQKFLRRHGDDAEPPARMSIPISAIKKEDP